MPSAVDVEQKEDSLIIHCGLTEYKFLLGMVNLVLEKKRTDLYENIHGLSTEIMPLTSDGMFFLDRRHPETTQHGVGFYDIPTAGQNAQMWIDRLPEEHSGLVKNMEDMFGFPRWNLMRHLGLKQGEIEDIFYTGFSRGFEVSLDSQFNGYVRVIPEAKEIQKRSNESSRLTYRLRDLSNVLDSIGNNGRTRKIKEDVYGNKPFPTEDGFRIVDDCLGTLLSNTLHLKGIREYSHALEIIKGKGYDIREIFQSRIIHLDDLD